MARKIGRLLGAGKEAEVFEYGDLALKLYRASAPKRSAFREAAALAIVEGTGLPVPRVDCVDQFDGRWGLIMTRAAGAPFADALASTAHMEALLQLHQLIHQQQGKGLPSLVERLATNIRHASALDEEVRPRLLRDLGDLPGGSQLCHGDFHPWNVLGTPSQAIVVDWLDAASGHPAADVCRSFILLDHVAPKLAADYVCAYSKGSGLAVEEIWRWLPVVAAARLAEGVPDEVDRLLSMTASVRNS